MHFIDLFIGKNNLLSSRVASETSTQNTSGNDRNIRNKSSSTNNCSSQKNNIFSTVNSKKVNSLSHPQTLNTADSNIKKKQQLNPYYQQQIQQPQHQQPPQHYKQTSASYGNDANCVNAPSKSFSTEHMFSEQCLSSKSASFKRKSPDNNGSKSSGKSSKSNQNQQITEGRGSFNSLIGAINYDSPSHRSHQLYQQPTNIVQSSRTYRQSSSNTPAESLDGSCTLVYSRSRVDSDSKNLFSSNKKTASGAKNYNINNNTNRNNNTNNNNNNNGNSSSNNNNSLNSHNLILNSYSNNGSSDSNQLRQIIELNKQASESNSKNIEFSRQLSAPNENQTSFNSVFNLHSNNLLNHQYYSGSPNTNSLNRTKKKRSFKLGGR
jgi:hypothetical protein